MRIYPHKRALFNSVKTFSHFTKITSKNHKVKTVKVSKASLNSFDDKFYLLPCLIHSHPYGSHLIKKYKGKCEICK